MTGYSGTPGIPFRRRPVAGGAFCSLGLVLLVSVLMSFFLAGADSFQTATTGQSVVLVAESHVVATEADGVSAPEGVNATARTKFAGVRRWLRSLLSGGSSGHPRVRSIRGP